MDIARTTSASRFVLMHKNNPVCTVEYDPGTALVRDIEAIHNPELLPPRTLFAGKADAIRLGSWWLDRFAPRTRLPRVLLRSPEFARMFAVSLGMSLSDHFWMKPEGSAARWADLNFFTNPFSDEVGRDLLGTGNRSFLRAGEDLRSPSLTANGALAKFWRIDPISGRRQLCKASSPKGRESLNEVAASAALSCILGPDDFVAYSVEVIDGKPWSVCDSFLDDEHDFVPMYDVLPDESYGEEILDYLRRFAIDNDIEGFDASLSKMFVTDALIDNNDRHFGNFGFLRNTETLEYEKVAPIFDCGYSFWRSPVDRTPFAPCSETVNQQLDLVSDTSWFDSSKLSQATKAAQTAFASLGLDPAEIKAIISSMEYQADLIADYLPDLPPRFEPLSSRLRRAASASAHQSAACRGGMDPAASVEH